MSCSALMRSNAGKATWQEIGHSAGRPIPLDGFARTATDYSALYLRLDKNL